VDTIFAKEIHELSKEEARELLKVYLKTQQDVFSASELLGVRLDYSKFSLHELFKKFVAANDHVKRSREELTTDELIWISRIAFYFGECLTRYNPKLKWSTGSIRTADANHPVISGFGKRVQAPLIIIVRNIYEGIIFGERSIGRFKEVVNA
jgi:hypothetical protein